MNILAFNILTPFVFILFSLLAKGYTAKKWIGVAGSMLMLVVALVLFTQVQQHKVITLAMGGWKAPYGIVLVADYLSAIMVLTTSFLALCIAIYSFKHVPNSFKYRYFFVFFFSLLMGINGAFLTGDAFNMYVWFEVMLMSSFVLITMGRSKQQLEGGIKYMAINLVGSLFFLAGLGLLYGKTGTLNMAHLAQILMDDDKAILMNTSSMLFFVAFGIKAGVFPLFFWLPSSYHTANITVASLFAGLLTKVGVYALIRFFTLFFVQDSFFWHQLILVIAGATMVIGGMAATTQYDTRKILSYHIISQIGYMVLGLGIYTPLAIAGAIYFTVHNMIAKTNTFLISGIIARLKGDFYLKNVGGLYLQSPLLAILFIIPAFALAGVPPLSGFFGKMALIKAGIEGGHYLITAVAVLTGLLTLYSMIKIWNEAFLKKPPENVKNTNTTEQKPGLADILPTALLAAASIALGLMAGYTFAVAMKASEQLLDATQYINAVLK